MNPIIFLVLRRMRPPLLTLIVVYAVAVLGLVLIPGKDAGGAEWRMDFFNAFYVVSYMSTTIGFGEIPHPFTAGQRLWITAMLYTSVISWLYAIGTLLALVQDQTFQRALREYRFARKVRRLRESFYLVCGYGQTAAALVRALTDRGQHAVVVDPDQDRISLLELQNLRQHVPALQGDAREPQVLLDAGLRHPRCEGVVALTNLNEVNLKVAISSKLLHSSAKVICRADSHEVESNMASFGTDHIVDPFDTFAQHLRVALRGPCLHLLLNWLGDRDGSELADPIYPPRDGHWILCGYGRFGKAVYDELRREGVTVVVVEAMPQDTGRPPDGCVTGAGTEAHTLHEAMIDRASAIVAGTDDDANNLSIIMTAKALKPELFVIARQNLQGNERLFEAIRAEMVMHPSTIIADRVRALLAMPMLHGFAGLAQREDDAWSCELVSRITALVQDRVPEVLELTIDREQAWSVVETLAQGAAKLSIGELLGDPWRADQALPCIALLRIRDGVATLLPEPHRGVREGDRWLLCGAREAFTRLSWSLANEQTLAHVREPKAHRENPEQGGQA